MSNGLNSYTCQQKSWALAAALSVLVLVLLVALGGWGLLPALLAAVLLCVVLGLVLPMFLCREAASAAAEPTAPAAPAAGATPATVAPAAASVAPAASEPAAAAATPDFDKDGVQEGTGEGSKPETLSGPRGGMADNLKEIKGVGPKLEKMLNEMGFYHFDQIADWTADEVAWVNANLTGFKGRVSRDNWVEQAGILASGGETEFSKRVEDGDVY